MACEKKTGEIVPCQQVAQKSTNTPSSEADFRSKLNFPRHSLQRVGGTRRRDCPECRGADSRIRIVELRRIEQVEEFRPQFKICGLVERNYFEHGEVNVLCPRALKNVPP